MDITTEAGYLKSLQVAIPYQPDPLTLYRQLCADTTDNLLLESAEIESKSSLKSLLMIDAAVKFVCQGQQVRIEALTENGEQLLPWLATRLNLHNEPQQRVTIEQSNRVLVCEFLPGEAFLDEDTRLRSTSNMEPLRIVQQQLTQNSDHPLAIFLGGAFAYDLIATFEELPEVPEGSNYCPDYVFYLAETLLVIDHQQRQTDLLGSILSGPQMAAQFNRMSQRIGEIAARCQLPELTSELSPELSPELSTETTSTSTTATEVTATPSREAYQSIVKEMQEHILAGDIFQVVPSRQFQLPCHDSLKAYQQLKQTNPSPYMFYLRSDDFVVFGASPESALKYQQHSNQVELYPIAGTRPRGKHADGRLNPDLDSRIELELRLDKKELAEHLMLVDLSRNDLARIAKPGTRYVADLLKVDRYSHVMHLVSRVVAELAEDLDALHAYQACMNMGTLVGAPKVSAARLIREVEQQRRGSYGGAVGYLSGNGDMDTCIVIRSAFVSGGHAIVQAGAGVVHDSDPISETDETESKARAVIVAIQLANAEVATGVNL